MPILLDEIKQYSESLTLGIERKYDDEAKYQVSVAQATCDQLIQLQRQASEGQLKQLDDLKAKMKKLGYTQ